MLIRITTVEMCDATGAEKQCWSWLQKQKAAPKITL